MSKVSVYNQMGKVVGEVELADGIFHVNPDTALVHEVLVAQRANARRSIASTLTKGEVRGGGKKPWKQKGTGRARQGSTRSPQWIGGGITFGPSSERNWSQKVNKKTKRKALFMALSDKLEQKKILVVDKISTDSPKTKVAAQLWKNLPLDKTTLFIAAGSQPLLMRMMKNLQQAKLVSAESVNLQDVLTYRTLVFLQDGLQAFEKIYV